MPKKECRLIQENYIRRFFLGFLTTSQKDYLIKHVKGCPDCRDKFEAAKEEPEMRSECAYAKHMMKDFKAGTLPFKMQEEEIRRHIEWCKECKELSRATD